METAEDLTQYFKENSNSSTPNNAPISHVGGKILECAETELKDLKNGLELSLNKFEGCIKSAQMMTYTSNIGKTLMLDLLDLAQVENSTFKLNKDNFSLIQVI